MRGSETAYPIWIKFCLVVDIADIIIYANFGEDRLRGLWVAEGQMCPSPLSLIVALTTLSHYRASMWPWPRVMEVQIPKCEWAILKATRGLLRTCPMVDMLKATLRNEHRYGAYADLGCTRWGAQWHHLAKTTEPCAVAAVISSTSSHNQSADK